MPIFNDDVKRITGCSSAFLVELVRKTKDREPFIRPTYPARSPSRIGKQDVWSPKDVEKVAALWAIRRLGADRTYFRDILAAIDNGEKFFTVTKGAATLSVVFLTGE